MDGPTPRPAYSKQRSSSWTARGATSSSELIKSSFIRGWSIYGGNCRISEPKIHRELTPVMGQVIEHAVSQNDIPRLLAHYVAIHQKPPRLHQMFVVCCAQSSPRFRHRILEELEQFL